jgi:AraC-like DNA-binding protein
MKNKFHVVKNYFLEPRQIKDISLYQVGRRFCAEGMVVPTHPHILDCIELTVVVDGKGEIITNDISTPVKEGDVYISFTGDFHKIISDDKKPLKYDFIAFKCADAVLSEAFELIMQNYSAPEKRCVQDEKISYLLGNIIAEINEPDKFSEEILYSMLRQLMIYIIRSYKENSRSIVSFGGITDGEALCLQLMNYIDTHIYTMDCLSRLSETTGYSYNYMSNIFKKNTSTTLLEYFHAKRMKTAKLLLAENKRSVSQIAELLGYSSIYTFSRAFKKQYGISPSDYKKQKMVR